MYSMQYRQASPRRTRAIPARRARPTATAPPRSPPRCVAPPPPPSCRDGSDHPFPPIQQLDTPLSPLPLSRIPATSPPPPALVPVKPLNNTARQRWHGLALQVPQYRPVLLTAASRRRGPQIACPAGTTSPAGSVAVTSCTSPAGYFSAPGSAAKLCTAGSYCPGGGAIIACPTGSTSPAGAVAASACTVLPGFYGRRDAQSAHAPSNRVPTRTGRNEDHEIVRAHTHVADWVLNDRAPAQRRVSDSSSPVES